jgi:hypothetical protein
MGVGGGFCIVGTDPLTLLGFTLNLPITDFPPEVLPPPPLPLPFEELPPLDVLIYIFLNNDVF